MEKKGGDSSCRLASTYGWRSSGRTWKIMGVGAAVLIALSYNRRDEVASEIPVQNVDHRLDILQMRIQLETWFEMMREIPILKLVGNTGIGEKGGIRIFENCIADEVTANDNTVQLSDVDGHVKVEFYINTFCGNTLGVGSIAGKWRNGALDGAANVTYSDGRYMEAVFRRGVIWGIVRTFRCVYGPCDVWEEDDDDNNNITDPKYLESLIEYRAGRPASRPAWWFPVGGGAIICRPDTDRLPDGEGCSYLYPDLTTSLVGEWVAGRMRITVEGKLKKLDRTDKILKVEVEEVKEKLDKVFSLDISSQTVISSHPILEDPFEQKTVYVAESAIENAGEGLFLRRDVSHGDLAAFYNGVRMTENEARARKEDRRSKYRIHGWNNEILNIPKISQLIDNYSATLGHKANHAKEATAEYRYIEHPRFGPIVGLFMLQDAVAGQEILVDYGYLEKFMATEAGIKMMLDAAQMMSGLTNKEEFKKEMKRTIGYVRDKVNHLKPLLNTFKMARNFMS